MNRHQALCFLEIALLSSGSPLSLAELKEICAEYDGRSETVHALLIELSELWQNRGLELLRLSSGWRFRIRPWYSQYLLRHAQHVKPAKYSQALMETLAYIAYHQPVTRGDIEHVRGVAVATSMIQTLVEREWIEMAGRKEIPGRPALYKTTQRFLDDFGLPSLKHLPALPPFKEMHNPNEWVDQLH
jgi:segregation and condensation protein B